MRLGELRVDLQRPPRRALGLGIGIGWRQHVVVAQQVERVREPGVGERVAGVALHCRLEMTDRLLERRRRALVPVVAPAQVRLVGLRILRAASRPLVHDAREVAARELSAHLVDDRPRNLVLNREHVVQVAVVALGPELVAVAHVGQLHRDAQAVAGLAHRAFENRRHVEALADLGDLDRLALVLERGNARGDAHAVERAQIGDELVGDPVAEVLLVPARAHVGEGQHGNRRTVGRPLLGPQVGRKDRRRVGHGHVAQGFVELPRQLAGGLEASGRLLRQAAQHDGVERLRHRPLRRQRRRHVAHDRREHLHRRVARERTRAGDHFVDDGAQCELIGAEVGGGALALLGRHVADRCRAPCQGGS